MVYIGLGSNLGDMAGYLLAALSRLGQISGFELVRLSPIYETAPVGPPQGNYLNAVLLGRSLLEPRELLGSLLRVENELGRVRRQRWGARTIDLDLLDYGGLVVDEPGLTLPHPRLHQRPFVLVPLAELDPKWLHPQLGKSAKELLEGLDTGGVKPWRPGY
ncbi:2-amino-4-hydroxy-6-hydroxymethyldihydropteridine diphosphokinase [Oceanithermus sp.]